MKSGKDLVRSLKSTTLTVRLTEAIAGQGRNTNRSPKGNPRGSLKGITTYIVTVMGRMIAMTRLVVNS